MAVIKITMQPEGSNDYADELHPKTSADQIVGQVLFQTATGTNTYAITDTKVSAYTAGLRVTVKFTNANTGASTLNINSLGAKSIVKAGGTALSSGNLKANGVYTLVYDGTNFQLQGEGGGGGTAVASDLLSGKTAVSDAGELTGTMPNKGAKTFTPSSSVQTDTAGYYSSVTCNAIPSNYLPITGSSLTATVKTGSTIALGGFANIEFGREVISNLSDILFVSASAITGTQAICELQPNYYLYTYIKDLTKQRLCYRFITFNADTPTVSAEQQVTDFAVSPTDYYVVSPTLILAFNKGESSYQIINVNISAGTITLGASFSSVFDSQGYYDFEQILGVDPTTGKVMVLVYYSSNDYLEILPVTVNGDGTLVKDSSIMISNDATVFGVDMDTTSGNIFAIFNQLSAADLAVWARVGGINTSTLDLYTSGNYKGVACVALSANTALLVWSNNTVLKARVMSVNLSTRVITTGTDLTLTGVTHSLNTRVIRLNDNRVLLIDATNKSYRTLTVSGMAVSMSAATVFTTQSPYERRIKFQKIGYDKLMIAHGVNGASINVYSSLIKLRPLVVQRTSLKSDVISTQSGSAGSNINTIIIP
jgi:hypothetical protein